MKLTICHHCRRHVKSGEAACPFCGTERADRGTAAARALVVAVGLGIAVAGCGGDVKEGTGGAGGMVGAYGPPPQDAAAEAQPSDGSTDVDVDANPVAAYGPVLVDAAYGPPPP
jgi:hypothetical protein